MSNPYLKISNFQRYNKSLLNFDNLSSVILLKTKNTFSLGSCFANNIIKYLKENNIINTLPGFSRLGSKINGEYDILRTGNIYTPAQMKQLFEEINNQQINHISYKDHNNFYFDALRPGVFENKFNTEEEVKTARKIHIKNLLAKITDAKQVILTFGMIEGWRDKKTKYFLPSLPHIRNKDIDSNLFEYHCEDLQSIINNIHYIVSFINKCNPNAKIFITVSPVPLVATYKKNHISVSNSASKSSLRASIEYLLTNQSLKFNYFPSYEMITSNFFGGPYLNIPPKHGVSEKGIKLVMDYAFNESNESENYSKSIPGEDENEDICEEYILANE